MATNACLEIFQNLPFSVRNMDIDITHQALETEGSMQLWHLWTASRPVLLEEQPTCDDPECVNGGGCDPLRDYMSCIRCFDNDDGKHDTCSWRDQYLSVYLALNNPHLSPEDLKCFLAHYANLKNSPRFFAVSPGLDGKMYTGLRDATRLLEDLRQDPTIKASPRLDSCLKSLESTLADLRIHNLYIALGMSL
ncbi:hypothetical protein CC1G_10672 [Coprinopsis cinerea okayama7|uniref:Uncharacterized protein n=1 Tax=Coprinopsis cinerea (strain Okayama-7 / 130 / ATCC MYA-4618 / FGSC 9003) TaxID=240176 RepID=A8NDP6_COPC7|nr:hypothetical protein CC1G_10672 [Coprinopsis cinerea okayama7\|eukprot:XP_001832823.2 hypothetical protein CC1G_10672 [Coprinopsis cinerea okayama7\